jgi:hypothetical protein
MDLTAISYRAAPPQLEWVSMTTDTLQVEGSEKTPVTSDCMYHLPVGSARHPRG